MKILVTGANGFVGSHLSRKLSDAGHAVRALVRETSDLSLLVQIPVERVTGALDDPESLRRAAEGADIVIHAAAAVSDWGWPDYFRRVNVEGTRNMLDAAICAGAKRFILISSIAVHTYTGAADMDEDAPQHPTVIPYVQTKREAETLTLARHREGAIEAVIIRPGDVFGPGDRVTLSRLAPMLERGWMPLISGGKRLAAFTYVENLADAILLAAGSDRASGEAFVITDGTRRTWEDYFIRLTEAVGAPRPRLSLNGDFLYGLACLLEGLYRTLGIRSRPPVTRYVAGHLRRDVHFSIRKAAAVLGYRPAVDFDEAVRKTAAWYISTVRPGLREKPGARPT
ncbi:MAG TPA: NAD-dependent epimerase/dehydratase family protein [bacterium]|nr:NAD-dependent epimerase/dehydratase family protein [bacterium]